MDLNRVVYFHPRVWIHLKRVLNGRVPSVRRFLPRDPDTNPMFWVGRLLVCWCAIDRTGRFNNLDCAYDPIPVFDSNFSKDFGQVCLETAEKYWAGNDKITVAWSGGIDSTAVALSLIETKPTNKDLEIICTRTSIEEYPAFYDTHKAIITIIENDDFFNVKYLEPTGVLVTGDVGDLLFGATRLVYSYADGVDKKDQPWQDIFLKWDDPFRLKTAVGVATEQPWGPKELASFIQIIEEHISVAPFEIKTAFDLLWWLHFTSKMNYDQMNTTSIIINKNLPLITSNKFDISKRKAFFQNQDFQLWSMANHKEKFTGGNITYKQPAKDFIFKMNGDEEYFKNKGKELSTRRLLSANWWTDWSRNLDAAYLVLEDGSIYHNNNDIPFDRLESIIKLR